MQGDVLSFALTFDWNMGVNLSSEGRIRTNESFTRPYKNNDSATREILQ